MYLLGSHVGMSGKDMMLGSVKAAVSYGANTFMLYTGAPQNTRRKKIEELNIPVETGVFNGNIPPAYVVLTPLNDNYDLFGDNKPLAETSEVRVSLFNFGNYTEIKCRF